MDRPETSARPGSWLCPTPPELWLAPWQVDITTAVKPGRNTLEIDLVNTWNNRLVGDAGLPADQRRTFLTAQTVDGNAALLPAGWLGPVTLRVSNIDLH